MLSAARQSFAGVGYDQTTMEAVAEAADVSIGTLYNYFPTKAQLLSALLLDDFEEVRVRAEALIDGRDPLDLITSYFEWMDGYERSLLRWFTAEAVVRSNEVEPNYAYLERTMRQQIAGSVTAMSQNGRVPQGVDPAVLCRAIFNIANGEFFTYLADDSLNAQAVRASINAQVNLISFPAWSGAQ